MARIKDKEKAIQLRLEGKSYSQIKSELGVGKGTLSGWLKDMPLSDKQFNSLGVIERRVERYKETCRERKEKILKDVYTMEEKIISPLSERDLLIGGLFLYWGEGGKTKEAELILSNTNPAMIKAFIYWAENSLEFPRSAMKIKLHLYKDMDIDKEIGFWVKELRIGREQFIRPYIKDSNKSSITHKNGFGHGTCNVAVARADLGRKVLMGLKVLEDYFSLQYK
jgi:hypothetical protein